MAESNLDILVPARRIPVSSLASDELRRKTIDAAKIESYPGGVIPSTNEEWRQWILARGYDDLRIDELLATFNLDMTSRTIAGVPCFEIVPRDLTDARRDQLYLNMHGGGFVVHAGKAGTDEAVLMAGLTRTPVLEIDYRMPPDHPFPASIDDGFAVWSELAALRSPRGMAMFGTSAGGNMVLAVIQRALREGIPLPAAICVNSPWSDLSCTGDSYFIMDGIDPTTFETLEPMARVYAGDLELTNPLVSPVYGDYENFPPAVLISGTRDVFLSNTVRVDRKLRESGIETRLIVMEGHAHADTANPAFPEVRYVFGEIQRFFERYVK
ncbi:MULTISPECIES: alpha/beta hydrolase [Sphingobium]|uniref:alpha/beta hydrolase n=1 Tax=Sphingobium sp. MI1205 TaxID=407020 RepID=UPI00076FE50F|nr:alpha/beta hydrolase [Sphingobium sp. MI1205]AMK18304.1 alpha/beta hydrolase domain-containing protein [Sphingobium sp. MI1205]